MSLKEKWEFKRDEFVFDGDENSEKEKSEQGASELVTEEKTDKKDVK
ncbi:hypothetical protein LCGC14_0773750 [marine sediment metagenome]|uniref:Uncharacterized protein n=1 Tax=marine sediment metagenome TaxID=412755 RepID=A0A0F9T4H0_9ZZZZ